MANKHSHTVDALKRAALALPGVASGVAAQSLPEGSQFRVQYYDYEDRQESGEDRIRVRAPMAWFQIPISEKTQMTGSYTYDSVSGASPLYHNTLTGASGTGIEDDRWAADVSVRHDFGGAAVIVGAEMSTEDDYRSRGGSIQTQIPFNNKNTVVSVGLSGSFDEIASTNNPALDERRRAFGGLVGVTQVVDKNSILQSNLTFVFSSGFHSDQYKLQDNRPRNRDMAAWLTRYNCYLESLEAAIHTDYRFALDSFGLRSHTLETKWYQPVSEGIMLRPSARFYTQNAADFYNQIFPPEDAGFYTADHRMGAFGGLTLGLKVIANLTDHLEVNALYTYIQNTPGWRLGGEGTAGLDNFYAQYYGGGVTYKW